MLKFSLTSRHSLSTKQLRPWGTTLIRNFMLQKTVVGVGCPPDQSSICPCSLLICIMKISLEKTSDLGFDAGCLLCVLPHLQAQIRLGPGWNKLYQTLPDLTRLYQALPDSLSVFKGETLSGGRTFWSPVVWRSSWRAWTSSRERKVDNHHQHHYPWNHLLHHHHRCHSSTHHHPHKQQQQDYHDLHHRHHYQGC